MIDCSVIIPHYNQLDYLLACLEALNRQKVHNLNYEIILVDNGSDQNIAPFIKEYDVRFFSVENPKNPYVCRNLGVLRAKGQILCFLDAKCAPFPDWLQNGYDFIQKKRYDLVAGEFAVEYNSSLPSKIFPIMYLNTAKNARHGYGFPCGNLFVKKELFGKVGLFETKPTSGNDIAWTRKVLCSGYQTGFCANSVVRYPAKPYIELLKDIRKYGQGAVLSGQRYWQSIMRYLMPMKLSTFRESLSTRNFDLSRFQKFRAWLFIWWGKVNFAFGMLMGLLHQKKS